MAGMGEIYHTCHLKLGLIDEGNIAFIVMDLSHSVLPSAQQPGSTFGDLSGSFPVWGKAGGGGGGPAPNAPMKRTGTRPNA
jgi:hypothetical protein